MSYKYHLFLSYRRYGEWPKWVEEKFMPVFKHYLGEELGVEPKIFFDVECIGSGVAWPKELGSALAQSRVLVPLFSKQYFTSQWCQLELANMLAREKSTGFNTIEQTQRLIVPARIHDGDDFPHLINDIQCACLRDCSNVRVAKDSPTAEKLASIIEKWVPDIVRAINESPNHDEGWKELCTKDFVDKFESHRPRQIKVPSLG